MSNTGSSASAAGVTTTTTMPNAVAPSSMTKVKQVSSGDIRRRASTIRGSTVSYHRLNYTVQVSGLCCSSTDKQILHGLDGIFKPGMNAIMGPTGSGKTTLLDVLAGRTELNGIDGHILIDGSKPPKNFKCMTGYVVQDDVVMGTLTVRENFMFSANLRLSKKIGDKEKQSRVEETVNELGLEACADTKIGTEFIRGVSGGERKRTNIGMELIISPSVLFLDEPTTGLDASTANAMMALLHRLSRRGCTVIFAIHQPRFAIFRLFDRLSLMSNGRTVYHGEASDALEFFRSAGYECEAFNNPPDFFLDVINGHVQASLTDAGNRTNGSANVELQLPSSPVSREQCTVMMKQQELVVRFQKSSWGHRLNDELQPILSEYLRTKQNKVVASRRKRKPPTPQFATSFLTQMKYVSHRAFINYLRNPQSSIMQTVEAVIFGVILGVIFLQLNHTYPGGLQSRFGALFFLTTNTIFTNQSAIEIFIQERAIFVHESANGYYRVSTYFLSKVFCDLIPMRVFPNTIFIIIVYFMAGFQVNAGKFFIFYVNLLLASIAASAIAFTISASVRTFSIAIQLTLYVYILSMIFGGLLANIENMGDWIMWLQYFSIVRYSVNTLSINEIKDLAFVGVDNVTVNGSQYLSDLGIAHETAWDLWRNVLALGIIAVGVECLAYIQLRRMKKLK